MGSSIFSKKVSQDGEDDFVEVDCEAASLIVVILLPGNNLALVPKLENVGEVCTAAAEIEDEE